MHRMSEISSEKGKRDLRAVSPFKIKPRWSILESWTSSLKAPRTELPVSWIIYCPVSAVVTKQVFLPALDMIHIPSDSNSEQQILALLAPAGALPLPMARSGPFQQGCSTLFLFSPGESRKEFRDPGGSVLLRRLDDSVIPGLAFLLYPAHTWFRSSSWAFPDDKGEGKTSIFLFL